MDTVFGIRPNLYEAFLNFQSVFWDDDLVDPVLAELCRLRIADLNACSPELAIRHRSAVDAGLTDEKILAIPDFEESVLFTPLERAGLRFASKFVRDAHSISDDDAEVLVAELGEPAMVAFTELVALMDGFARFRVMLGVDAPAGGGVSIVDAPTASERSSY